MDSIVYGTHSSKNNSLKEMLILKSSEPSSQRSSPFIDIKGVYKFLETDITQKLMKYGLMDSPLDNSSSKYPFTPSNAGNKSLTKCISTFENNHIVRSLSKPKKQLEAPMLSLKDLSYQKIKPLYGNSRTFSLATISDNQSPRTKNSTKVLLSHDRKNSTNKISIKQSNECELLKKYLDYLSTTDQNANLGKEHLERKITKVNIKKKEDNMAEMKLSKITEKKSDFSTVPSNIVETIKRKKEKISFEANNPKRLDMATSKYNFGSLMAKSTKILASNTDNTNNIDQVIGMRPISEDLIKDLAYNLRQLALINPKENEIISIIEKLTNKNAKLIDIILPKNQKIIEMDIKKLERRFKTVEIVNGDGTICILPKLKKSNSIIIDYNIFQKLEEFNKDLEQYNIEKESATLKSIEACLAKIGDTVSNHNQQYQYHDITNNTHENNRLTSTNTTSTLHTNSDISNLGNFDYYNYRNHHQHQHHSAHNTISSPKKNSDLLITNVKHSPKINMSMNYKPLEDLKFLKYSILENLKDFEYHYGEMKFVKRRNIAYSRALDDLTQKWIKS